MSRPIVLAVDDEPSNLELLERVLGFDYEIHKANNGEEALAVLNELPDVAVIITDQKMPGLTGTEFLKRARVRRPEAVRMIVTGFAATEELIDAINSSNVYRFMTKPWDIDDMLSVVQRAARLAAAGGGDVIDDLTGLPKWALTRREIEREVARAGQAGRGVTLLTLRIAGYDEYASLLGTSAAEQLAASVAEGLRPETLGLEMLGLFARDVFVMIRPALETESSDPRSKRKFEALPAIQAAQRQLPSLRLLVAEARFPRDGASMAELFARLGLER